MPILVVGDSFLLASQYDTPALQDRSKTPNPAATLQEWEKQNHDVIDALREQGKQQGVEVRLHMMSQSNRIVIRFMETDTGQVIQEFPSERLMQALRELQQNLTVENHELPLVDQRV